MRQLRQHAAYKPFTVGLCRTDFSPHSLIISKCLFFTYTNLFICKTGIVSRASFVNPLEDRCGTEQTSE